MVDPKDDLKGWYPLCKPDSETSSIINWVEHDRSKKELTIEEGTILLIVSGDTENPWVAYKEQGLVRITEDTKRYAIIPFPEFLT